MTTAIRERSRNKEKVAALLLPSVVVVATYVIVPTLGDWLGSFIPGIVALYNGGAAVLESQSFQKYIGNLEGFLGELTLLIASGLLAVWIWQCRQNLQIFRKGRVWLDIAIGVTVAVIDYYCGKKLVVPWLYLARPLGSEWIKTQYVSVGSYGTAYINQIASVFFVDTVYVSLIETIVIVGFMYRQFRSQWSFMVSIPLAALIFAAIHRNELLFFDFFLFGLVNLGLFELRKSLAAPLVHHLVRNALIYGSQLALFSGIPSK